MKMIKINYSNGRYFYFADNWKPIGLQQDSHNSCERDFRYDLGWMPD